MEGWVPSKMKRKNIYNVDSIFIILGIVVVVVGLISIFADPRTYYDYTIWDDRSFSFENAEGRSMEVLQSELGSSLVIVENGFPLFRTIIVLTGVLFMFFGIKYRRRENKIIAIWDALERTGEAHLQPLSMALNIPQNFILKHLETINAQQDAYFVWLPEEKKIMDGRFNVPYKVAIDCAGCGNKSNQEITLSMQSAPECAYCGRSASTHLIQDLKDQVLAQQMHQKQKTKFNVAVFVILLLLFWPAALLYLFVTKSKGIQAHAGLIKGELDKLMEEHKSSSSNSQSV